MLNLQTMRFGAGAATRRGFGLLAIVWLNLALTPCAIAFEGEHECPHGSEPEHHEMAGHHGQMAEHSCASMQESCCEIADATVDTRGSSIEFEDSPDLEVLGAPSPGESINPTSARYLAASDPPDPPASSRALHKLFCVYLK